LPEENWDNELEYLQKSRFLSHNDDYLEFLVKKVWRLKKPTKIVDFGCGFGYMGTRLLPLLPEGSSYTGVDKAPTLLKAGRDIFAKLNYHYRFVESEVYQTQFADGSFDVAVSHAVLMHLERPADALKEMIRVTRNGGLVITADANRNAWNALFYVDELNTQETTPLELSQKMNKSIREKSGVDYNIGIKTPVLMEKAGLKNIGCRMSDSVTMLFPSMEEAKKKRIFEFFCMEGLALPEDFQKTREKTRERLLSLGVRPEDVEKQFENEEKMDFRHQGMTYHNVIPNLLTWSYGTVVK
jgi:ubiquinone/menaquinone biosynthesis C-methylase UbiE